MAHEITMNGSVAEFAFTGSRSNIWHGLGQELPENSTHEEWIKAAGMAWDVLESPITFKAFTNGQVEDRIFPDRKALFRSDTLAPLSIVSNEYKVVTPRETLDFFNDVAMQNKMKLSSAGTLFGGKRFFANAETFKTAEIVPGDEIKGYLLFVTSVDGTIATTAKFTSTRTVCNNTLTVAMSEKATKGIFRKTHRSVFNANECRIDLGLIDENWNSFITSLKTMADTTVTRQEAIDFFKKQSFKPEVPEELQGPSARKYMDSLVKAYDYGDGSSFSNGTLWGLLNAVTQIETHGIGRKSPSSQFWNSHFGTGEVVKTEAFNSIMNMVAA